MTIRHHTTGMGTGIGKGKECIPVPPYADLLSPYLYNGDLVIAKIQFVDVQRNLNPAFLFLFHDIYFAAG